MIKCVFRKRGEYFTEFEIFGHANYDEKGKDIVCAAVSTVSQHTARALQKEGAHVEIINTGKLRVERIAQSEVSQRFVAELVETLLDLSEQYPKYIRVNMEVNDDVH
ncbi:ribosomal-processing cysteine protease Prp [Fervidobacterium thailandense]|uniref:Ribosomal processing cysteine protease Prp n=1 Tax=Fervidobacterium thailandense TaxID=1008305 RepID=A0A1E3G1C8_9BACT|nr:ribosomal-processing cysteine protease Prp [Fervidobacterium thailandense]ODN30035.1 hypothetical protein A4H02_07600 [Fervidobacterium thailandense]